MPVAEKPPGMKSFEAKNESLVKPKMSDLKILEYQYMLQDGIPDDIYRSVIKMDNKAPDKATEVYRRDLKNYLDSIIEKRKKLLPKKIKPISVYPDSIDRETASQYINFWNRNIGQNTETWWYHNLHDVDEDESDIKQEGHYLLENPDVSELEEIIVTLILKHPFEFASIKNSKTDGKWQAAVRGGDDRYKHVLSNMYTGSFEEYRDYEF